MGTRSIIAVPYGDAWRGRYCHWDGYPTHNGHQLFELVRRDGLQTARKVLTEDNYGWSSIKTATDESDQLGPGYTDGRFAIVPGYGTGYTTERGQSDPEEWITHDSDKWGTEWLYVLADMGLMIGKVDFSGGVEFLTTVPWHEQEVDWSHIERLGWPQEVEA